MVSQLPGSSLTSMKLAWPATASSMAVVQDLRRQMVQRRLVGAADIHARAAADRFQPFEDLDVLRGVVGIGLGAGGATRGTGGRFRLAALAGAVTEQVVHAVFREFRLVL